MIFRILIGLFVLFFVNSCSEQSFPNKHVGADDLNNQIVPKNCLLIDNGINRGLNYTDSEGTDYSLRYIPITVTNDSTKQIQLQIAFSKEYSYPNPDTDEFKLIPLPKKWALEGIGVTDSMMDELPNYINRPFMNKTIEPGEKIIFAIGSLYPRPAKTTGVLPRKLFVQMDSINYVDCDLLMEVDEISNQQMSLGLKIIFGGRCRIIRCGHFAYLENKNN